MDVAFSDLAQQCAPMVAIETLAAVATVESGLNPYAIRMTSGKSAPAQPKTKAEAIELAMTLMVEGHDMDLGLGGLRSSDLSKHGLTTSDAFDPCLNIKTTGRLIEREWRVSVSAGLSGEKAIRRTLAAYYGDGDPDAGYLARYDGQVLSQMMAQTGKMDDLRLVTSQVLPVRGETTGTFVNSAAQDHSVEQTESVPRSVVEAPSSPRQRQRSVDVYSNAHRSSVFVYSEQ